MTLDFCVLAALFLMFRPTHMDDSNRVVPQKHVRTGASERISG